MPAWSFTDNSWNPNEELEWTSDVIVDNTIPTCTITPSTTAQTNTNVTLTLDYVTEVNQLSGWYSWTGNVFNSTNTKVVSTNWTYTAYVKDAADNIWSCQISVSNIDKTPPQITSLTTTNTPKSGTQRLTWTCTDGIWITKIYLWTNSNPADWDYKVITSTESYATWMRIGLTQRLLTALQWQWTSVTPNPSTTNRGYVRFWQWEYDWEIDISISNWWEFIVQDVTNSTNVWTWAASNTYTLDWTKTYWLAVRKSDNSNFNYSDFDWVITINDWNVNGAWTYYFFCKDAAWNVTSGSKIYDSYTVNNMLETESWTKWSYNTTNYATASSDTYIAPRQTSLILANIYTVPENASSSTYTWFSTSSSTASPNKSATTTLNGSTTYYAWFDRERYHLDLIINTWINQIGYKVNGASGYAFTQSTLTNIETKAWSTIYAYATPKAWYAYTDTSSANPWTVVVTWDNTFSPEAVANDHTPYEVYHYVKPVWTGRYNLTETETWYEMTDSTLILSSLAKSGYVCVHYRKWSLTWTDVWPWEIVTEAIVAWDGSTKIYLYYDRDSHRVILSGDEHIDYLKINTKTYVGGEEAVRECGSEVPVEAIPKEWYHFVRWEEREEREEKEEWKR